MSEAEPSEYYDEVYNRPGTVYQKRYNQGEYAFKYIEHTQRVINEHGVNAIVEIGCGMGHMFETALHETKGLKAYTGMDFSKVSIEHCARIYKETGVQLEGVSLFEVDLNEMNYMPVYLEPRYRSVYITHETLEHFEKDVECLEKIPAGVLVVISVPDFGGKGHVRWGDKKYWQNRYQGIIDFTEVKEFGSPGKQHIFLVGNRKIA